MTGRIRGKHSCWKRYTEPVSADAVPIPARCVPSPTRSQSRIEIPAKQSSELRVATHSVSPPEWSSRSVGKNNSAECHTDFIAPVAILRPANKVDSQRLCAAIGAGLVPVPRHFPRAQTSRRKSTIRGLMPVNYPAQPPIFPAAENNRKSWPLIFCFTLENFAP